jgi:hypothetical protein
MEHKLAACRYYIHRLNTLPLTTDRKNRELNTIKHIAARNGYSINIAENLNRKIKQSIQKRSTKKEDITQRKKRIVVTYTGPPQSDQRMYKYNGLDWSGVNFLVSSSAGLFPSL